MFLGALNLDGYNLFEIVYILTHVHPWGLLILFAVIYRGYALNKEWKEYNSNPDSYGFGKKISLLLDTVVIIFIIYTAFIYDPAPYVKLEVWSSNNLP